MSTDTAEGSLSPLSLAFAEALYADYLKDPNSVPPDWREYFAGVKHDANFTKTPRLGPSFRPATLFNPPTNGHAKTNGNGHAYANDVSDVAVRQDQVDALLRAYRVRGHMIAKVDPLGLPRPLQAELDPEFYGLTGDDLE